jgi:hypothetical protein
MGFRIDSFQAIIPGKVTNVIDDETKEHKKFRWAEIQQTSPKGFGNIVRVKVMNGAEIKKGVDLPSPVTVIVEKGDTGGVFSTKILF